MHYDPIKKQAGNIFNCCKSARIIFYQLLHLLLLRSWHIRKEIRRWSRQAPDNASVLDAGSGFGQYVYFVSRLNRNYLVKGIDVKQEEIDNCNRFFTGNINNTSNAGNRDDDNNNGNTDNDSNGNYSGKPHNVSNTNITSNSSNASNGDHGNNVNKGDNGRISFEKADLNSFVEPDSYDLILCIDVLEHIKEDVTVMGNLCKSLKKGGMLIISTPSDQGGSDVHEHGQSSFIEEHVRDGYGRKEIGEKLIKAGFSKTEVSYSYGRPGQLSWKISMKYPIKMLNLGRIFFLVLPFYYMVTLPFAMLLNFMDLSGDHASGTGLIVRAVK